MCVIKENENSIFSNAKKKSKYINKKEREWAQKAKESMPNKQ